MKNELIEFLDCTDFTPDDLINTKLNQNKDD